MKYPRSWHMPWSPGLQNDDRRIPNTDVFKGHRVIVTEKFDGECTTVINSGSHARSPDSANHPSRDLVKGLFAQWQHELPDNWRVCGENVYALHSVPYTIANGNPLPSFFLGFSVWSEEGALGWDETLMVFETLGVTPVRVLYDGIYDEDLLIHMTDTLDGDRVEGYVVRHAGPLSYEHFIPELGKIVRKNHVQTDQHWRLKPVVPNELGDFSKSSLVDGRW